MFTHTHAHVSTCVFVCMVKQFPTRVSLKLFLFLFLLKNNTHTPHTYKTYTNVGIATLSKSSVSLHWVSYKTEIHSIIIITVGAPIPRPTHTTHAHTQRTPNTRTQHNAHPTHAHTRKNINSLPAYTLLYYTHNDT